MDFARRIASFVGRPLAWLSASGTLFAVGEQHLEWTNLFVHWLPLMGFTSAVAAILLLLARRWKVALLSLLSCSYALLVCSAWLFPNQPIAHLERGAFITVMTFNVYEGRAQSPEYAAWIRGVDPDLALFIEANEELPALFSDLKDRYPLQVLLPARNPMGMILAGKWPAVRTQVHKTAMNSPLIEVEVETPLGRFVVFGAHPMPPISIGGNAANAATLEVLKTRIAATELPIIVLGDLNLTPWSPRFRSLLESTRLEDPRRQFGLKPTWPDTPWLGSFLGIPIDHVLYRGPVTAATLEVGPSFGSDHRPLCVRLASAQ